MPKLDDYTIELVEKWFRLRFPNEQVDGGYYKEWIYRFEYDKARDAMDDTSEKLWDQVCRREI
jgi:hypothetical protein